MKKVIDCFKENNPLIQKNLERLQLKKEWLLPKELFEILNKRKDVIA